MPTDARRIALADFAADPIRVFEEVVHGHTSVIVEGEDGARAVLQPADASAESIEERIERRPTPGEIERTRECIRRSSGHWQGLVDAEEFKEYLRERRKTANRPSVQR
jgi:hypothetical protein